MFSKLLIANRGEIACRIMRTAKRLNIPVAAVYSDADRNALHKSLADQSVYIGGSRSSESYLNVDRIMDAARQVGADALHPGYGFLSENSALAKACETQGIEFIGPSSDAIERMASKSEAARIAIDAGVPMLPGVRETEHNDAKMTECARSIGFPILLKAAAGGGGRGMRIVHTESQLLDSLQTVRAQALEFFGDDLVIIEKYLQPARHVEVQVAADKHGHVVHLFDRDCSAQRRYQKIVEEAPAPQISQKTRQQMYEAAICLTKALNYFSVGTIEYLLAGDAFYFMEMNTRLQVEHPVTEQVTGTDLVEWQLRIAAGESISKFNRSDSPTGHSIQARIYAENPKKQFLPSSGTIDHLHLPAQSEHLQIHTGVRQADPVDMHYDPLIAKIVVHDADRAAAIARMQQALYETRVIGVETNVEFLANLLADDTFQCDVVDTGYVEKHWQRLSAQDASMPTEILVAALFYVTLQSHSQAGVRCAKSDDYYSPWRLKSGWRMNSKREFTCCFEIDDELHYVTAIFSHNKASVQCKDRVYECTDFRADTESVAVSIAGENWRLPIVATQSAIHVFHHSARYELRISERISLASTTGGHSGSMQAPLPGRIARVLTKVGEHVKSGQTLVVIEAMKMEHPITSPIDGVVTAIPYCENELVDEGASCAVVEPVDDTADE